MCFWYNDAEELAMTHNSAIILKCSETWGNEWKLALV